MVLNSLNGEHIPKSLAALAPGGRFVEIGKVGIWEAARVAEVRPDVAYHTFDLGEVIAERPEVYGELLALLAPGLASGQLRPVPTTVVPLASAVSAFQLLASGKTIGKIVLSLPAAGDREAGTKVARRPVVHRQRRVGSVGPEDGTLAR